MGRWFKRKNGGTKEELHSSAVYDYVLAQGDKRTSVEAIENDTQSFSETKHRSEQASALQESKSSYQSAVDKDDEEIEQSDCLPEPDLHWRQRVIGSSICPCLGTIISSSGFRQIATAATNQQAGNVLQTALGNLLVLISSCFWTGPTKQIRAMWQQASRRFSSAIYAGSIFTTIGLAFLQPPAVSLYYFVLMIIQYVSVVVYALSYIPCAKRTLNKFIERRMTRGDRIIAEGATDTDHSSTKGILA